VGSLLHWMNKTHFIDYTIFITLHYVHGWKGLLFRDFQLFHRDSGKASGADKSAPTGYLDGETSTRADLSAPTDGWMGLLNVFTFLP
jgi:hypothetical protein